MNYVVVLSSFLASSVELVEAFSIVLAVAVVYGWGPAWRGTLWAIVALVAVGVVFGPALAHLPLSWLRLGVGTLILLMGLKWLRKAILRSAGRKAQRNELEQYAKAVESMKEAHASGWAQAAPAFNGVFIEGLEVIVIVITLGASSGAFASAVLGALIGVVIVVALAAAVRGPLAQVPENALKFVVGILLMTMGTLWVGEGVSVSWPGGDMVILWLLIAYALMSWYLVNRLQNRGARHEGRIG